MPHTNYQDPNIDHTSWIHWLEENLKKAKDLFQQLVIKLQAIIKFIFFKINEELRFFISKLTVVDFLCLSITGAVMALASFFLFSGFGIICYQIFLWMKNGIWSEFSIEVVFSFLFENTMLAQWLNNPESWFGLQRIVEWLLQNIPLSAALIIPSVLIFGGTACILAMTVVLRFYQFKNSENS